MGGKNLRDPFQLIIHLVHPDLRDYSRLKKKGEQFEGGREGGGGEGRLNTRKNAKRQK